MVRSQMGQWFQSVEEMSPQPTKVHEKRMDNIHSGILTVCKKLICRSAISDSREINVASPVMNTTTLHYHIRRWYSLASGINDK